MAERRHILEPAAENSFADPAGVVKHVEAWSIAIIGISWLKVSPVKAEYAALVRVAVEVEIRIGEQERGEILDVDGSRMLGRTSGGGGGSWGCREQQIDTLVDVD